MGLAAVVFASTNVDDFFLLLAFFSERRSDKWKIVAGQVLGVAALVALSMALACGLVLVAHRWIGLLGVVPILIGIRDIFRLQNPANVGNSEQPADTATAGSRSTLAIAGITIANGADNIGFYVPLFATVPGPRIGHVLFTFALLLGLWCLGTYWLVFLGRGFARCERALKFAMPVIFILLGACMLATVRHQIW